MRKEKEDLCIERNRKYVNAAHLHSLCGIENKVYQVSLKQVECQGLAFDQA